MDQDRQAPLTLRDYLAPVVARRWLILAIVAVVAALSYAYYSHKAKTYQASTKVYVAQEGDPLVGVGAGYSDDRTVENQATLLTSTNVAAVVAKKIGYPGSAAALAGQVTATPATGADFVTITARGSTGVQAAQIANGFAQAFIDERSAQSRAAAEKALAQTEAQLKKTPQRPSTLSERQQLHSTINQLQVALSSGVGNARQIDPAQPAGAPLGVSAAEKTVLTAIAALIGSIFLAYMLYRLDPRLRRTDEAVSVYGKSMMASILRDDEIDAFADGLPTLSPRSREAFRQLRISLDLTSPDQRFKTILVTSAGSGEGKSTVARNLALAFHETGRRVALIDADIRKPGLPTTLGVKPGAGLTEVVAGDRRLADVKMAVAVDSSAVGAGSGSNGADQIRTTLTFVPAGATPPNPPAVLESAAFAALLDEVAAAHDVVVIDTAPLGAVVDAVPLLGRIEAAIMVVRSGKTDLRAAGRAAETIERVPNANLVGVVINGLEGAEAAAYGGGYGYGYGDDAQPRKRRLLSSARS